MGGTTNAGPNGGFTRMRSSSMSMIERSEAAWAILGSTGGYRSKSKYFFGFICSIPVLVFNSLSHFAALMLTRTLVFAFWTGLQWTLCRWR